MAQQARNKKIGRYREKVRLGLVPSNYDRNSRSFGLGAWKNWSPSEAHEMRRKSGIAA
jgi:hypothetical protein